MWSQPGAGLELVNNTGTVLDKRQAASGSGSATVAEEAGDAKDATAEGNRRGEGGTGSSAESRGGRGGGSVGWLAGLAGGLLACSGLCRRGDERERRRRRRRRRKERGADRGVSERKREELEALRSDIRQ